MTQILIFILVILIGVYYAYKNGNDSKKKLNISNHEIQSQMILWEEDYLMIEIMSVSNFEFAKKELIKRSTETKNVETKELKITKTELKKLFEDLGIKEYEKISYLGIGEQKVLKNPSSKAFGDLLSAIFIEGETDKVDDIWLSSFNWPEINKTKIIEGLNELGKKYDMILVDFYPIQNKIVNLKNKTEIQNYLNVYIENHSKKKNTVGNNIYNK